MCSQTILKIHKQPLKKGIPSNSKKSQHLIGIFAKFFLGVMNSCHNFSQRRFMQF